MQEDIEIQKELQDRLADVLNNIEAVIESLGGTEAITPKLKAQIEEFYKYSSPKEREVENGCACVSVGQKRKR